MAAVGRLADSIAFAGLSALEGASSRWHAVQYCNADTGRTRGGFCASRSTRRACCRVAQRSSLPPSLGQSVHGHGNSRYARPIRLSTFPSPIARPGGRRGPSLLRGRSFRARADISTCLGRTPGLARAGTWRRRRRVQQRHRESDCAHPTRCAMRPERQGTARLDRDPARGKSRTSGIRRPDVARASIKSSITRSHGRPDVRAGKEARFRPHGPVWRLPLMRFAGRSDRHVRRRAPPTAPCLCVRDKERSCHFFRHDLPFLTTSIRPHRYRRE